MECYGGSFSCVGHLSECCSTYLDVHLLIWLAWVIEGGVTLYMLSVVLLVVGECVLSVFVRGRKEVYLLRVVLEVVGEGVCVLCVGSGWESSVRIGFEYFLSC